MTDEKAHHTISTIRGHAGDSPIEVIESSDGDLGLLLKQRDNASYADRIWISKHQMGKLLSMIEMQMYKIEHQK